MARTYAGSNATGGRDFTARHDRCLIDVDLLGFWNSGTTLSSLVELDIGRSGTHRKLSPDHG